jgi:hypothetical protein
MKCSQCNKIAYLGETWIRSCEKLMKETADVTIDLVNILEEKEIFCSTECLINYVKDNNLKTNFDTLKIDVMKSTE